ncbi:MAG: STAS domain-containing protein [Frankia sp.]
MADPLDAPARTPPTAPDAPPTPVTGPEVAVQIHLDHQQPGGPVIRIRGTVDRSAAGPARRAMSDALAPGPQTVVVDLGAVTAIDPTGAVLMVAMTRHARRLGAALRIDGAEPEVRAVLRKRRVEQLLTFGI